MVAVPKGPVQHQSQRQLDADHPTAGITQYVPGPPPLEQYAPEIPVRVLSPLATNPTDPSLCIYSLSYYSASNCRRCPTTAPPVTYPFLTT
jgi:hypothetical protein